MGDDAELETEYETERVEDELSAALARLEETTRRIDALLESGAGAVQSGGSEWDDAKEDARAVSTADDEEE